MNKLLLASNNPGKVLEIKNLLPKLSVFSLKDLGLTIDIEEDKDSFTGNALKKAMVLSQLEPEYWVMADDSGLCCEALNGAPGIFSARYAGTGASDAENVTKLLQSLHGKNNRKAYFECALAFVREGIPYVFSGKVHGQIADTPAGTGGFGYDPVFIPDGHAQSFAELDASVKKKVSHRAEAISKWLKFVQAD